MIDIHAVLENPFHEFAIILIFAALLGFLGKALKQPLIVMFIFLGVLLGPAVFDLVKSKESIHLLAEIGISILLFIVGLKLDLRIIKSVGKIALLTGLGQVLFTSFFGFFIAFALGFSSLHSFYIAVALTFSSTIIIVKLLSDKKEIDSLHGQIAIGFLIVQDIVVILMMIILSTLQQDESDSLVQNIFQTLLVGGVLAGITFLAMKFVLPKFTKFLAQSQELLILFAVSWAVALASLAEIMGFSGEVGAFLAGISLASSDYKENISNRLVSLRDFLLLFFFVGLGSNLDLSSIQSQLIPAIYLSVFVLVGNPIIVLIIMGRMGYRKRTSFLAGLTVAQISEFSLIFAGLGFAVGHITDEVVGLITLVGLITIALSTYLILYSHQIYEWLSSYLSVFESTKSNKELTVTDQKDKSYDLVLFGLGRFGSKLAKMLDKHPEISYLGIDFDPKIIQEWRNQNRTVFYGDIDDPDLFEYIPYEDAKVIINTVSDFYLNQHLVKELNNRKFKGKLYLTALNEKDYNDLQHFGVENVLLPQEMAATNFYNDCLKGKLS